MYVFVVVTVLGAVYPVPHQKGGARGAGPHLFDPKQVCPTFFGDKKGGARGFGPISPDSELARGGCGTAN